MKTWPALGVIATLAFPLAAACSGGETAPARSPVATPLAGQRLAGPAVGGPPATGGEGSAPSSPVGSPLRPGDRLTVQGYGSVTAPVDTVILGFGLVLDPGFDPIGTPCPPDQLCPPPSSGDTASPPLTEEDLAPIITAVKEQHVAEDQIVVIGRYVASGAGIYITVRDIGQLDAIVNAATAAIFASNRVALLDHPSIAYVLSVEKCLAFHDQARDAALADARQRALYLVRGFDVAVGEVISVEEHSASFPCSQYEPVFDDEIGFRLPVSSYLSGQPLEQSVISYVTVTFAIR